MVGFVLLGIFDDFCKVFHAVFQFHNALFGRFSRFGFHSNLMLQIGERTNFIIALCSNLQILDSCPLLESGTALKFFIRGINEAAGQSELCAASNARRSADAGCKKKVACLGTLL